MDTKKIIDECKKGIEDAQRTLFMKFSGYLYGVINKYVNSGFLVQDILQESFIIIFNNLEKFEYKSDFQFYAWIKKIAIRETIKNLKKNNLFFEPIEDAKYIENTEFVSIISKLNKDDLLMHLKSLPDGFRTIFNMYAIEGYSHSEIAKELGIAESTSRSQLTRARSLLQKRIIGIDIGQIKKEK